MVRADDVLDIVEVVALGVAAHAGAFIQVHHHAHLRCGVAGGVGRPIRRPVSSAPAPPTSTSSPLSPSSTSSPALPSSRFVLVAGELVGLFRAGDVLDAEEFVALGLASLALFFAEVHRHARGADVARGVGARRRCQCRCRRRRWSRCRRTACRRRRRRAASRRHRRRRARRRPCGRAACLCHRRR